MEVQAEDAGGVQRNLAARADDEPGPDAGRRERIFHLEFGVGALQPEPEEEPGVPGAEDAQEEGQEEEEVHQKRL